MKIFLSSLENNTLDISKVSPMHYNLISYYYGRKVEDRVKQIYDNSELIMIDSGAHSFQKGVKVDWERYTEEYAEWIRTHDCEKVVGYFEMDVDNILGYDKVRYLRSKLEKVSDKIIPVWHKNRGIEDYKQMCQEYSGRVVAITGFKNEDIQDHQYKMFLKYAWEHNCKVHCLGMTRIQVLDEVPFDFVDSSTWTQRVLFGHLNGRKLAYPDTTEERREMRKLQWEASYLEGMKQQEYYEEKWATITRKAKSKMGVNIK